MALDPGSGSNTPPGNPFAPWHPASSAYADAALGWSQPQFNFPDYGALMEQYMAPFRAIFESQIKTLQENIARQQEYAKKQEALGLDNLNQQHGINDRGITSTLQARGLQESGEPTYRHGIENKNFSNAKSSMENTLANTLAGLQAQFDQAKFSGLMGLQQQQLGLLPFIQSTYQPTVTPAFGGLSAARGGLPNVPSAPPFGPPAPVRPAGY